MGQTELPTERARHWTMVSHTAIRLTLAATLIAAAVRIHQLGQADLWLDEGVAWDYSQMPDTLGTLTYKFNHPPLYRLITRAIVQLGGDSVLVMRLFPAFCGVLLVPLLVWLARRMGFSTLRAVAIGLAFALNPMAVYLAQWHRHYSLAMLLAVWLSLVYLSMRDRGVTKGRMLHYGLVLAAGMYTYYLFLIVPLAHGLAAFFDRLRLSPPPPPAEPSSPPRKGPPLPPPLISPARMRLIGGLIGAAGIAFVVFLPWFVMVLARMDWGSVSPLARPVTGTELPEWLVMSFYGKRFHFRGLADPTADWLYFGAVIFVPLVAGIAVCARRREFWLPTATIGLSVLIYVGFRHKYQLIDYYHNSPVLPLLVALHTIGLAALVAGDWWPHPRSRRSATDTASDAAVSDEPASVAESAAGRANTGAHPAKLIGQLAGVSVALMLVATSFYGLSDQFNWGLKPGNSARYHEPFRRAPWKQAAEYISRTAPADATTSAVVVFPEYTDYVLRYYLPDRPVVRLFNYIPPHSTPEVVADDALNRRAQQRRSNPSAPAEFFPPIAETKPTEIFVSVVAWEIDPHDPEKSPQVAALIGRLRDLGYYVSPRPDRDLWGAYRRILIWRATKLPAAPIHHPHHLPPTGP